MNRDRDSASAGVERRRKQVQLELRRAAFEIMDVDGWRALSIRAVGARSHYARGTISYHVPNFERFRTELWQIVGQSIAEAVFTNTTLDSLNGSSRSAGAATRILEWTRAHHERSKFFVEYVPLTRRDLRPAPHDEVREWPVGQPVTPEMHFFVRKFQAAMELALRAPDDAAARERFQLELESIGPSWFDTAPPPTA